jgi:hypothetical protein
LQFDRGGPLTGVMVGSPDYVTQEGLRVGSTIDEVVAVKGQPKPSRRANRVSNSALAS